MHLLSFDTELNRTASINSLPVETLSEIFTKSSDKDYNIILSARQNDSFTAYPWNLRLVCKHWDEVVLSSPQLWTSFLLNVCSLPELELEGHGIKTTEKFQQTVLRTPLASSLRLCLLRSKNYLLRLIIVVNRGYISYLPTFLSLLLPYASRWEALYLDFGKFDPNHGDFITDADLLLSDISFPQLRELRIETLVEICPQDSLVDRFSRNAPLLSTLWCSSMPRWLCAYHPMTHITDYTTTIDSCGRCQKYSNNLDPLPLMPALVRLTVIIRRCIPTLCNPYHETPSIHPAKSIRLQSLNLFGTSPIQGYDVKAFFGRLASTPDLTHLQISSYLMSVSLLGPLQRFLRRSKCVITNLELEHTTSEPLLELIQIFPLLETLDLYKVHFSKTLIEALTFPLELDGAPCNGRWIEEMVIMDPVFRGQAQIDGFVKMLESRLGLANRGEELRSGLAYVYVVLPAGKATRKRNRLVKLLTALRSSYKENVFLSDR